MTKTTLKQVGNGKKVVEFIWRIVPLKRVVLQLPNDPHNDPPGGRWGLNDHVPRNEGRYEGS